MDIVMIEAGTGETRVHMSWADEKIAVTDNRIDFEARVKDSLGEFDVAHRATRIVSSSQELQVANSILVAFTGENRTLNASALKSLVYNDRKFSFKMVPRTWEAACEVLTTIEIVADYEGKTVLRHVGCGAGTLHLAKLISWEPRQYKVLSIVPGSPSITADVAKKLAAWFVDGIVKTDESGGVIDGCNIAISGMAAALGQDEAITITPEAMSEMYSGLVNSVNPKAQGCGFLGVALANVLADEGPWLIGRRLQGKTLSWVTAFFENMNVDVEDLFTVEEKDMAALDVMEPSSPKRKRPLEA
mmetsp:Transcript_24112/g.46913  ORF Transcript_24112/g.46913 Transcript_24112/m.46913 type:complete len:302 (-) Transcript_24112:74-979(-)